MLISVKPFDGVITILRYSTMMAAVNRSSLTVSGLQQMLNICNNTILDMDLSFNCKKSVCIRFGPVCKLPLQTCILVAQQLLGVTVLDILV